MGAVNAKILDERLKMLGIDSNTTHNLALVRPKVVQNLDRIIEVFYTHFSRFPEFNALFKSSRIDLLKHRQAMHWSEMFECRFDHHYVSNVVRIGQIHFAYKVPPRLYLAGHNHIHCSIIEVIAREFGRNANLPVLLASISRIIALDIDLALSAYTRAYWTKPPEEDNVWV